MFHNVDEEEKNLFIRIFLMFHNVDEEEKNLFLDERSMGCGNELDDFQIAELMKRYEYKKRRNHLASAVTSHLAYSLYFVTIRLLNGRRGLQYIPVPAMGN